MLDRCQWRNSGFRVREGEKSRDQRNGPGVSWLVARIKLCGESSRALPGGQPRAAALHKMPLPQNLFYAVLLGRSVRSRNWVRTLDICIPFSCETKGMISAMNWSFISSLISS
jgi:hypothetical protein